ncbi:MAG: prepilin-type N-terminal cleavage/methylation domain-containing protein [Myxococcota bacterium]
MVTAHNRHPIPSGPIRDRRGITLIELMIVLLIMAGIFAGGISLLSSLSRSKLKAQAMRMSGMLKYAYAQAAVRQQYYRVVLDLEGNAYWLEVAQAGDRPGAPPQIPEMNYIGAPDNVELPKKKRRTIGYEEDDPEGDVLGLNRPKFQQVSESIVKRRTLTDGIRVVRVFTSQDSEGVEEGRAGILFFPNGFVEPTLIVLGDENTGYMSLELEPLTGKVNIYSGEQDPSRDFFEAEEDK